MALRLRKNAAWALSGSVALAGGQFVTLYGLDRLGSAEVAGAFTWGLSIAAPIFLLFELNLRDVQSTLERYGHFAVYAKTRALAIPIALGVAVGAIVLLSPNELALTVALSLLLQRTVDSISDLWYGVYQKSQRLDFHSQSQILRSMVGVAITIAVLLGTGSVVLALTLSALASLGVSLSLDARRAAKLASKLSTTQPSAVELTSSDLVRQSAPLGIDAAVASLIPNVPRLILTASGGLLALALLAPYLYIGRAHQMFSGALGQASVARFSELYFRGDIAELRNLLRNVLRVSSLLNLGITVGVLLLGVPVVGVLFGAEYNDFRVLVVLSAATTLLSLRGLVARVIQASAEYKVYLGSDVFVLAIVTLSSASLIPEYGALGLAFSLLLAYGLGLVLNVWLVKGLLDKAEERSVVGHLE